MNDTAKASGIRLCENPKCLRQAEPGDRFCRVCREVYEMGFKEAEKEFELEETKVEDIHPQGERPNGISQG